LIPVALSLDILALPGIILANPVLNQVPWTHGLFMSVVWR
jgi:hypothetical protein